MRRLYLVRARRRSLFGETQYTEPSRFLDDIPDGLIASMDAGSSAYDTGGTRRKARRRDKWDDDYNQDYGIHDGGRVYGAGRVYPTASKPPKLSNRPINAAVSRPATPSPTPAPTRQNAQPASRPAGQQFKPGDRVRHDTFGEGVVLKSEMEQHTEFVEVQFQGKFGKKRLSMDFARLEKL